MKIICYLLLLLPIFVCISCVSQADYDSCVRDKEELQTALDSLYKIYSKIENENEELKTKLFMYEETFGEVYEGIDPPYKGVSSIIGTDNILLDNNQSAINPSWTELVEFLKKDTTEKIRYWDLPFGHAYTKDVYEKLGIPAGETPSTFVCSDFANLLHDNSEAIGIRTAVVVIDTTEQEYGHALNAFLTTDKGLVYIDCTGEKDCSGVDKICFLKKGTEPITLKLEDDVQLDYEWFKNRHETQKSLLDEYNQEIIEYNQEVEKFNQEVEGRTYIIGTRQYGEVVEWEKRLKKLEKHLSELEENLEPVFFEEGIVTNIEIYW